MNLAHSGGLLHSTRDPIKEGQRFAENLARDLASHPSESESRGRVLLIAGIGWGHHIAPVLKALPGHELIFFEPIREVREILNRDRAAELRDLGARLVEGPDELRETLAREYSGRTIHIQVLPAYARLFPEIGSEVRELCASPGDVDQATAGRFMRQWARNFFINLLENEELEFLTPSADEPPETDVLYCGAGPGLLADLNAHLETLRVKERGVRVLAADSALGPLLHAGIRPDLVLSVDSGRGTAYHYRAAELVLRERKTQPAQSDEPTLPFPVLSWSAGPRFARRWFERLLYYRSTLPFEQILGQSPQSSPGPLGNISEWVNPTRNPAGLALLFAHAIGARRVFTAGADFRAREDRSHERGTGYAIYALDGINRVQTLEMYRPGGYGEETRGKNRLALEGLEKLSAELGPALLPLSKDTQFNSGPAAPPLFAVGISSNHIRRHLREIWEHLDFASLPGPPDGAQIEKWRALLG